MNSGNFTGVKTTAIFIITWFDLDYFIGSRKLALLTLAK